MFRALQFPSNQTKLRMDPPIAVLSVDKTAQPVDLDLTADGIFATAVGPSTKRTWLYEYRSCPASALEPFNAQSG